MIALGHKFCEHKQTCWFALLYNWSMIYIDLVLKYFNILDNLSII